MARKYQHLQRNRRGSIILQNGDRITVSEQKQLNSLVSSANRKRKRLIEQLPEEARVKRDIFGVETDFLFRKKTTSISRFNTKTEFKHYIRALKRIVDRDFERKRVENYKRNYCTALRKTFNSKAKDIIKYVKELPWRDFKKLVESDRLEEIGFVYYDPSNKKLQHIGKQLGMQDHQLEYLNDEATPRQRVKRKK